jgi:hypothetical protein
LDFQPSFFKAKAAKPPVELAPTAVNSAVVIQAGHIVDFVSPSSIRTNGVIASGHSSQKNAAP